LNTFDAKFEELNDFITSIYGCGKGWEWKEDWLSQYQELRTILDEETLMKRFKKDLREHPNLLVDEVKDLLCFLLDDLKKDLEAEKPDGVTIENNPRIQVEKFDGDIETLHKAFELLNWFKRQK
jgi:hypothetical protein